MATRHFCTGILGVEMPSGRQAFLCTDIGRKNAKYFCAAILGVETFSDHKVFLQNDIGCKDA